MYGFWMESYIMKMHEPDAVINRIWIQIACFIVDRVKYFFLPRNNDADIKLDCLAQLVIFVLVFASLSCSFFTCVFIVPRRE